MQNNKMFFSIIISLFTFLFVGLLIYIIYCYGFYDNNIKSIITEKYNRKQFDELYNYINNNDGLNKTDYEKVITLMYDQTKLEEIYQKYYENSTIWDDKLSFLNTFYYGENKLDNNDIIFNAEGKTSLTTRANITADTINVKSKSGLLSQFGVATNIKLLIDQNGELIVDDMFVSCEKDYCLIPKIYKGLHEIKYKSNGYQYYGIINIKDEKEISITNNETLVTISSNNTNQKIKKGYYYLTACYLESSCPSKKKSYIHIIDDKNVEFKTYISLDQAGDYYRGTYEINNGFIELSFVSHKYSVFDYDTKRSTDINVDVDIHMSYKIIDTENLKNDDYFFSYTN